MVRQADSIILHHLRQDARKSIAKISRETNIPVETLFNKIEKIEGRLIKKYAAMLDFSKLGYNFRVVFIIKSNDEHVEHFLKANPYVNSISRLVESGFYVDAVFKSMIHFYAFVESLNSLKTKITVLHVEEIITEKFYIEQKQ